MACRFLTLLGLRIFLQQQVDVAILEVGLGGRLDATNVVPSPVVCGISSLGFDHMELLGYTLPEIAREKAGILKKVRVDDIMLVAVIDGVVVRALGGKQ